MSLDDREEARAADVVWRGIRAQMLVLYAVAGVWIGLGSNAATVPYVLAGLALVAAAGTGFLTHHTRAILAPHRDAATGELLFRRPRLRVADVIPIPSALRNR